MRRDDLRHLSYIIVVQPAVLGVASMDFEAVLLATCLASALATLVMGLYADRPSPSLPRWATPSFFA